MISHHASRPLRSLKWLATCALALAATFSLPPRAPSTQPQGLKHSMPTPPESAQKNSDRNGTPQPPSTARRAKLIRDEKEFRDGVQRLYQLSMELNQEVQQTPTSAVLSVPMVKKAEAIEKLAKQLKTKAQGN